MSSFAASEASELIPDGKPTSRSQSILCGLVKTGGRLVKHARYHWLLLAEGHLTRQRFGSTLRMIAVLSLPDV
jgi:hypothetical protein